MSDHINASQTKAGFVAIIGAPNAGKSTLLNSLLAHKLAVVSPKVQTTRTNIRGVLTQGNVQYVFVDTPGIHDPRRTFDKAMVQAAWQALTDADVVLFVLDGIKGFDKQAKQLLANLKKEQNLPPVHLVVNKIDKVAKTNLLPLMAQAAKEGVFKEVVPLSALKIKEKEKQTILELLAKELPESPYLYDEETLTDMPSRLWAAEATRERAFLLLGEELPYSLSVETLSFDTLDNGSLELHQNIYIERDGQKKIVVGKNGQMLKKIGEQARKGMENMFDTRVHLFVQVKVRPNWASDIHHMRMLGLEQKSGQKATKKGS